MYGTSTLRISDARPSLQTVGPLYQKTVQQGKRQKLQAAITGRSASLPAIGELTRGKAVYNQRHQGSKLVRIADIQARRAAGQTMKQIAKAHNTSDTNILRVMRRFKLKESERAD